MLYLHRQYNARDILVVLAGGSAENVRVSSEKRETWHVCIILHAG